MGYLDSLKTRILSLSIGMVYLIFGLLKFFPHLSPAEDLAKNTINILTLGILPPYLALLILAGFETTIGIFLILNWKRTFTVHFAIIHILLTFSPLFIFPEQIFGNNDSFLTLVGQYILKNIIILSALLTLKIDLIQAKNIDLKKSNFLMFFKN